MFKDVISRDNGEPWGPTGMTSEKWFDIPLEIVTISSLIATQPGVYFKPLMDVNLTPIGGDDYPHVVKWRGEQYLEDGHHRIVKQALIGRKVALVRVLDLDTDRC